MGLGGQGKESETNSVKVLLIGNMWVPSGHIVSTSDLVSCGIFPRSETVTYGPMAVGAGVTVQMECTMWVQMEKTVRKESDGGDRR